MHKRRATSGADSAPLAAPLIYCEWGWGGVSPPLYAALLSVTRATDDARDGSKEVRNVRMYRELNLMSLAIWFLPDSIQHIQSEVHFCLAK